nr:DUF4286 family protein [Pedobacter sp. ASV19]
MLLYNVTFIVEEASGSEWLDWMQQVHIPKALATGAFISNKLLRVVDSPNEGITFCCQYTAEHMADYLTFKELQEPALDEELNIRFKDRFVSFRTLMEYIA